MHNKNSQQVGIKGNFLKLIKNNYKKPTANIIFNGEMLKALLLRSGTRLRCRSSLILYNTELEALATAIRQEKEVNGIRIGKEDIKLVTYRGCD